MTPALFFHPDQVEGEGRALVGRRVAGTGFLRGWLAHAGGEEVRVVTETAAHGAAFEALLRGWGEGRPVRAATLRGRAWAEAGCVVFPSPGFHGATWRRQRAGAERCSLVGLTHTVSTRRIVEGFHALHSEPVEAWDAIVCTSRAVRGVVARQFEAEAAFFRARFGATRVPQPRLPVIPLGVDGAAFAPRDGAREAVRAAQGAPDDAVVVMTMGRLSVVEKANPLPLFQALEIVARGTGRAVHLWLAGWASRPEEEALHREGAGACPSVTVRILDGRDPAVRRDAWAGADLFTLPSDSIQETFGLVAVEAMAAGLPVVMPDWDGFRDTVRHGETGLLVPTRMAPPGMGRSLARRYADGTDGYLHHLALVQSQVAIDVGAYAEALGALVADADLRRRMGARGRAHVAQALDWRAVVPRYLDLARELAEARRGARPTTPALSPNAPSPLEIDPFELYAGYPSATIGAETPVHPGEAVDLDLADRVAGRALYDRRPVPVALGRRVLDAVAEAPGLTVGEIARRLRLAPPVVAAAVLGLAKAHALRLPRARPRA